MIGNSIKSRLKLYFSYLAFWLAFFIVSKLIFLVFHFDQSSLLRPGEWIDVILHGFALDFSAAGYIMLLPGLVLAFTSYLNNRFLVYFLNTYTGLVLLLNCILLTGDLELYSHWKYRLDATPLLYLNKPGEVFGSVEGFVIARQLIIGGVLFSLFYISYFKFIKPLAKLILRSDWRPGALFIVIVAISFVQIRGGVGVVPINVSRVYFHKEPFANHAAVNLFWNVGNSLTENPGKDDVFTYMNDEAAEKYFNKLFCVSKSEPDSIYDDYTGEYIVKKKKSDSIPGILGSRPNIILVILESFTGKVIKPCGGLDSVTPNFNKLALEGLFFNNFYASGDRSDKGIAAILSGYPAQPRTSVMKYPAKTQKLPFLSKELKKCGYSTMFMYGGDSDFANIMSYLLNGGFDKIISRKDFDKSASHGKWGVHDHVVFDRLLAEADKERGNFFHAIFTLSSHDPFDIPEKNHFNTGKQDDNFLSSIYYTDKSLGNFVRKAKTKKWWKNTILIFVADHGNVQPGNTGHWSDESFKIPMLWIGGGLNTASRLVPRYASQTDLARTILEEMNLKADKFIFGKNALAINCEGFAYFAFNNGFGFMKENCRNIYDNISSAYIVAEGAGAKQADSLGKAFLQVLSRDFISK